MKLAARRYRFSTMLVGVFLALSVPTLIFVLSCAYIESSRAAQQVLAYDVTRGQEAITRSIHTFFAESIGAVEGLARIAEREPEFFRTPSGALALQSQFMGMNHLDAISIAYEDGFSVGSTRVDDAWRKRQPETPADAVLHNFRREASPPTAKTEIHEGFVDESGRVLSQATTTSTIDPRELSHYPLVRRSMRTVITEPITYPDTEEPMLSVAAPIVIGGAFKGVVFASVTTGEIARFLHLNRVTPQTIIAIIDDAERVIVPPLVPSDESSTGDVSSMLQPLKSHVADAIRHLQEQSPSTVVKSATVGGVDHLFSLSPVESKFNIQWRLLMSTPKSDFIGPLQRARKFIIWLLVIIIPLQLLLIYKLSRRISKGIEAMAQNVRHIRSMDFESVPTTPRLLTHEIAELHNGIGLLNTALRSFAQYIPLDVVRQLISKGQSLTLGVEERTLAVMFTDLENFSTVSQSSSPAQLLSQLTASFSAMTAAITEELGTVDKFIGDSVMAFWGAPVEIEDSALRACKAALRITRRMERLNQQWRDEGKASLKVRIGINYASVLVGNIGTPERLSYTALGDGVNVASRLEGSNKQFNTSICISDVLYSEVADAVEVRALGLVSVKGRTGDFPVYELLGIRDSTDPELMARSSTSRAANSPEYCL
jgi:class 3 adenylate cyclase